VSEAVNLLRGARYSQRYAKNQVPYEVIIEK